MAEPSAFSVCFCESLTWLAAGFGLLLNRVLAHPVAAAARTAAGSAYLVQNVIGIPISEIPF